MTEPNNLTTVIFGSQNLVAHYTLIYCSFQTIVIANANVPPQGVTIPVIKHDQKQMGKNCELWKKILHPTYF